MASIKADEITKILRAQIANYEQAVAVEEVGTVISVGDGIARVYGLEKAMSGEMLAFPHDVFGIALNLEEDQVGAVLLGEYTLVQEGDTGGARIVLEKALALKPDLARTNFFYARILKEEGKYVDAIARLRNALAQYPRDRVVRNEVGRILFLQKKYSEAVAEFSQTLSIDPEDLQAHYNLMLCYSGLGDEVRANEHKERYLRFKADESAQAITGPYRQAHPEDNNERQPIHEHVSVALNPPPKSVGKRNAAPSPVTGNQPGGSH